MRKCDVCGNEKYVQRYMKKDLYLCGKHRHHMARNGKILTKTVRDKNDVVVFGKVARVILRDRRLRVVGEALIDANKLEKICNIKWCLGQYGYAITGPRKGSRLMHRILFGKKGFEVDHVNGNRLDNRCENIRIVSRVENSLNKGMQSNNSTGVCGVYFDKQRNKYVAEIKARGKKIHLGRHDYLDDAKIARVVAEKKYFGNFRRRVM